jgi:hypothetical protein
MICNGTHVVGLLLALLGTTTEAENQVKSGFLLDVVVTESTAILELLACEDQALLVGGNANTSMSINFMHVQ